MAVAQADRATRNPFQGVNGESAVQEKPHFYCWSLVLCCRQLGDYSVSCDHQPLGPGNQTLAAAGIWGQPFQTWSATR